MGEENYSELAVSLSNIGLIIAYIILGITALGVLIFFVVDLFKDPKQAVRTIAMLVGIVLFFLVGYLIAGSPDTERAVQLGLGDGTVKLVSGALITVYVLAILGIIGIVVSEIVTLFR